MSTVDRNRESSSYNATRSEASPGSSSGPIPAQPNASSSDRIATQSAAAPIVNPDLRSRWIGRRRWSDYVRYGIPLVSSLVLIASAILLLIDPTLALYLIAIVIVLYLVVGVQNAWNLLLFGRFELGLKGIPHADEESSDGR